MVPRQPSDRDTLDVLVCEVVLCDVVVSVVVDGELLVELFNALLLVDRLDDAEL